MAKKEIRSAPTFCTKAELAERREHKRLSREADDGSAHQLKQKPRPAPVVRTDVRDLARRVERLEQSR